MAIRAEFVAAAPELAAAGHRLIYQYGPGLGYLATVRADGGPRIHPICPIITAGGLYTFIVDSSKRRDLLRDVRRGRRVLRDGRRATRARSCTARPRGRRLPREGA